MLLSKKLRFLPAIFVILVITSCSDSSLSEQRCIAPENPYTEGTGHYAGYEWAEENGGVCDGSSDAFNEGCEEFNSQEDDYERCTGQ